ncbi:MAG: hypothetical protein EOO03_06885 [Chitinophagaceae bacterium]|nr:MAG: hypothetical protein EOO03_06885 [Chitinophagaceae bacterium]
MSNFLQKILKPFVSNETKAKWQQAAIEQILQEWNDKGRPAPAPHSHKQQVIAGYQKLHNINVLVETGTFMGDMVEAQKNNFKKIISIELSEQLFEKARQRFAGDARISIVQGDSGRVLHGIMKDLNQPAIFWLDGHYSAGATARGDKDCPIFEEVDAIFAGADLPHVLLVDDARLFIGTGDYPTVEELTAYIQQKNAQYKVEVKDDVIRYSI